MNKHLKNPFEFEGLQNIILDIESLTGDKLCLIKFNVNFLPPYFDKRQLYKSYC